MDNSSSSSSSKLHVGILCSPGIGHLVPVFVLGNRLAAYHNVKVTVLVTTTNTSQAESQLLKLLSGSSGNNLVDVIEIPPAVVDATNEKVVTQLSMMVREALPGVKSTIASMNHRPHGLIVDLFCTEVIPIARRDLRIPVYVYVPTTAWFTALTTYCQVLDKEIKGQYVDQTEPLRIPGCKPVRPEDVVDPMLDRNDQQYKEYLRQGIEYTLSDGILLNSWESLEPTSLKALRENKILQPVVKVPVYTVGPLMRPVEAGSEEALSIMEWLDRQPSESVIYVSFGSGGTLSAQQITELAWGLEMSQQRFLWVVRPPAKGGADETFFTSGSGPDDDRRTPDDYLPDGFITRTERVGLVIQNWAPQAGILGHPSVGGFLSHCGWNSTLESIAGGVPMIAWPLYAEQRLNATMLTEELGVAVRPRVLPTKKVVEREEIERMVRTVMQYEEGKVMMEKVKKLKASGEMALKEEDGSSYKSMRQVLRDIEIKKGSLSFAQY